MTIFTPRQIRCILQFDFHTLSPTLPCKLTILFFNLPFPTLPLTFTLLPLGAVNRLNMLPHLISPPLETAALPSIDRAPRPRTSLLGAKVLGHSSRMHVDVVALKISMAVEQ